MTVGPRSVMTMAMSMSMGGVRVMWRVVGSANSIQNEVSEEFGPVPANRDGMPFVVLHYHRLLAQLFQFNSSRSRDDEVVVIDGVQSGNVLRDPVDILVRRIMGDKARAHDGKLDRLGLFGLESGNSFRMSDHGEQQAGHCRALRETDDPIIRVLGQFLGPPFHGFFPSTAGGVVFEVVTKDPPGPRATSAPNGGSIYIGEVGDVGKFLA